MLAAVLLFQTPAPAPTDVARVRFTETWRRTGFDRLPYGYDPANLEPAARPGGEWRVDATLPLQAPLTVDAGTVFEFEMGGFKMAARAGDDPDWKPGATRAAIPLTEPTEKEGVRRVIVVANVAWSARRLTARISSRAQDGPSLVAKGLLDTPPGDLQGTVPGRIAFGPASGSFGARFRGTVRRRTTGDAALYGEFVEVRLRG